MKISPRNLLIIAAAAIVLVAVALVVLLILPQNSKMKEIDAQVAQTQEQIDQAEAVIARRQASKKNASLTAAELLRLSAAVPETPELPSLIIELQTLTTASGLQFRSLTPATPVAAWENNGNGPAADYLRIPMSMQVLGTWSDTVDFLQRVQRLPRQLRITSISSASVTSESLQSNKPDPMPKVPILTDLTLEAYVVPSASAAATSSGQ